MSDRACAGAATPRQPYKQRKSLLEEPFDF